VTRSSNKLPPTAPPPLGAAILYSLGALLLAGLAVVVVFASGVCEYDCPTEAGRLVPGALLLALTWIPLAPATAVLIQRRGRQTSAFGWPAGGIGVVLTCYLLAVGGLAWAFGSNRTIHGDLVWALFWAAAIIGAIALALALVAISARR
jgi:hypothetical protein